MDPGDVEVQAAALSLFAGRGLWPLVHALTLDIHQHKAQNDALFTLVFAAHHVAELDLALDFGRLTEGWSTPDPHQSHQIDAAQRLFKEGKEPDAVVLLAGALQKDVFGSFVKPPFDVLRPHLTRWLEEKGASARRTWSELGPDLWMPGTKKNEV
jgi:hypothetical protein